MRKLVQILIVLLVLAVFTGWVAAESQRVVLSLATSDATGYKVLNDIAAQYQKDHPNVSLEITVLPGGVAGFNTAMASKFVANDAPDLFIYQWGSQITEYARGGHLMDLTDIGIKDSLKPINRAYNQYNRKIYAYPLIQQLWGVMYNSSIGEKAGITELPKTMAEFTADMDKIKAKGQKYPFIVPAKDGSGACGFIWCYEHQIISGKNPAWYYQVVTGKKSWNCPEWKRMLSIYSNLLKNYSSPDYLGLDVDGANQRFASGQGAFYVASPSVVSTILTLNPSLKGKILYIPFPVYTRASDYATVGDFDHAISIWSKTKHPKEALGLYKEFFKAANNIKYATAENSVSTVKNTPSTSLDPSLVNQAPLLEAGKYVGFAERQWVPGIKEIMKTNIQQWMAGQDVDATLNSIQKDDQRLLNANPQFVKDFKYNYTHSVGQK